MPRFPAGRRVHFADGTPALEVPMVNVAIPEPARELVTPSTTLTIPEPSPWLGVDSPWISIDEQVHAHEQLTINDWWDGYLADMQRRAWDWAARFEAEHGWWPRCVGEKPDDIGAT